MALPLLHGSSTILADENIAALAAHGARGVIVDRNGLDSVIRHIRADRDRHASGGATSYPPPEGGTCAYRENRRSAPGDQAPQAPRRNNDRSFFCLHWH